MLTSTRGASYYSPIAPVLTLRVKVRKIILLCVVLFNFLKSVFCKHSSRSELVRKLLKKESRATITYGTSQLPKNHYISETDPKMEVHMRGVNINIETRQTSFFKSPLMIRQRAEVLLVSNDPDFDPLPLRTFFYPQSCRTRS